MKKLMIAAAIVCAAVVSQAASFKWAAEGITNPDGTGNYDGTAMLTVWDAGTSTVVWSGSGVVDMGEIWETGVGGGIFVQGNYYDAQFTITDTDGVFTSRKITGIQATAPSDNTLGFSGGSWQTVPEPTSGLLLLLGVAGLALRRRRA